MDEDDEEETLAEEVGAAFLVLKAAIEDNGKLLQKAIIRKNRALQALAKADSDISVFSGAMMALEDVARRLRTPPKARGADPMPAPPMPEPKRYITLSGEHVVPD